MKKIEQLVIENVKGIRNLNLTFNEMHGNQVHFLVAPNGFGKSSLALAFNRLNRYRINLEANEYHNNNDQLLPTITLTLNIDREIQTLIADCNQNQINQSLDSTVINSKLYPKTRQGYGNIRSTSEFAHEEIELVNQIPTRESLNYRKNDYNVLFRTHRASVLDIREFFEHNDKFTIPLLHILNLNKLSQARYKAKINRVNELINENQDIINHEIEGYEVLKNIYNLISQFDIFNSQLEKNITYYQIIHLFSLNYNNVMLFLKRTQYLNWKNKVANLLNGANSSFGGMVHLTETDGSLKFSLNNISMMSNGQRDVVSFIAQLYKAEFKMLYQSKKDYFLIIIDEIFDYLDDANMITCQYFLSKYIQDFKELDKTIFPLVLTHLAPKEFETYRLKKVKHHYLKSRIDDYKNVNLRKIILGRSSLNFNDVVHEQISKYYLHYHSEVFTIVPPVGLINPRFNSNQEFYEIMFNELNNYISETGRFDPLTICTAIRIKIEKRIFILLDSSDQITFISLKGTNKKLDFASSKGINLKEEEYLLGILYNEALHVNDNSITYLENKISHQLNHPTIKKMITQVV